MTGGAILTVVGIIGIAFVVLVLAFIYAGRYKKVGPNEVLIISGLGTMVQDPTTGQRVRA